MHALFQNYPRLKDRLDHIPLADLPTPIEKLDRLGRELGLSSLYVKRDDLTSEAYGGNKVRKLEFVFGDALARGAREVLTFGYAGSNHGLATAIYARKVGLTSISMLLPQPNAHYVRRNLLMSYHAEAELHQHRTFGLLKVATAYQMIRHKVITGKFPQMIPPGGSSPLGAIGFVNAALELKQQVDAGIVPEPDYIYVALGSMGTAVGLILGALAGRLKSRVIPVRVGPEAFANARGMVKLFHDTNNLLSSLDESFPKCRLSESDTGIRQSFFGKEYALFTEEGANAVKRMIDLEGIKLDGTYTGKTLAALIADSKEGRLKDKTVLFWNTYNSRDFSKPIAPIDYRSLPTCFHRYFEEEVQPLDRLFTQR